MGVGRSVWLSVASLLYAGAIPCLCIVSKVTARKDFSAIKFQLDCSTIGHGV